MGDLAMEEDRPFSPSFAAPLSNPDPSSIRAETWVLAEDPVREVLNCIHPTLDSDEKRKDVIEYVQKLIRCNLRLEVFPYGSVPLKTYLPDGDIDLTVLSTPNLDETLPREVLRVLQEEEHNGNTEFVLKDTQFIDAEVKLVKCLVQDIVIDISFNQLGGLCTLCFLEQVDRLVGKDHLFKRSIILIKAWCYYESRILGAHHGLISTYALETLVLYIFHVFNASLNSPTEVLYRFLDYYSKFDWDEFCISLDGPVSKSSMPDLTGVETPENEGTDLLLSGEFRKNCMDMFIVPSKGLETDQRAFALKHLNIIDPLKENNNLGRSVHRGNYYRIRSAFRFGAKKLGRILESTTTNIGDEIKKFFTNTLQRHKPKHGPALIYDTKAFGTLSISSLTSEAYYEDDIYSRFSNGDLDDYNTPLFNNNNNDPNLVENKVSDIQLWMERGGSQIVDGDTLCLCFDKNGAENGSDNLSVGETDILNPFSDLTGDYDAHIRNLLYGQGCHGYALSTPMVRTSPPTSPYEKKNPHPWDPPRSVVPFQPNTNGVVAGHPTYLPYQPNAAVRGTGPYIPFVNGGNTRNGKSSPTRGRGRNRGPPPMSNGHVPRGRGENKLVVEPNPNPNRTNQIPHERSPRQGRVDPVNGFVTQPRKLEFGSFRSTPHNNSSNVETPQTPKVDANGARIGENSFHLKNEEEFPPLSG